MTSATNLILVFLCMAITLSTVIMTQLPTRVMNVYKGLFCTRDDRGAFARDCEKRAEVSVSVAISLATGLIVLYFVRFYK